MCVEVLGIMHVGQYRLCLVLSCAQVCIRPGDDYVPVTRGRSGDCNRSRGKAEWSADFRGGKTATQ